MATTIITTAASVTKLITDFPNIINEAVLGAIQTNSSIPSSLIADINYGFNSAVNKFYRYGTDYYLNGIPFGTFIQGISEALNTDLIAAINADRLARNTFALLTNFILTNNIRKPEIQFMVQEYFQDSTEWNLPPSYASIVFGDFGTAGNFIWQNTMTNVANGKTYGVPRLANTTTFNSGVLHMEVHEVNGPDIIIINVPKTYNSQSTAYNTIYQVGSTVGGLPNYYFWVYSPEAHRHPALEFEDVQNDVADFFPIVPIRLENENIVDSPAQAELATSARILLNKINIDLDKFSSDLTDPNDATALDDVDAGYLLMAMTLDSNTTIAHSYLYEYFRSLYYANPIVHQREWKINLDQIGAANLVGARSLRNHLFIKDLGVDILIMFNFITLEVKSGLVDDVHATYDDSIIVSETGIEIDEDNTGLGNMTIERFIGTELVEGENYYNDHAMIYRKQLTAGTFVEIVVHGLQHEMAIVSGGVGGRAHRTIVDTDGAFFIPISQTIVQRFNGVDESLIYYESLIFLAYAVEVIKLKWYQEQAFLDLIVFVILIVAIIFQSPELFEALSAGFIALLAYVAEAYVISLIVSEAFSLIAGMIGGEAALIMAAIAAGVALYYGKDTKFFNDLLDAEQLMKYATLMIEVVNTNTQEDIVDLQQEVLVFQEELEDAQEAVDSAYDMLRGGTTIDLMALAPAPVYTDFTETPTDFYNRSIHLTNPGVLSLDLIDGYVTRALTIPKPV